MSRLHLQHILWDSSVLGRTSDLKREESLSRVSSLLGFNKLCFTFTIFSHLQGESAAPGQSPTKQTRHTEFTSLPSLTGTIFTVVSLRSLQENRKCFAFPISFAAKRPLFRLAVTHERTYLSIFLSLATIHTCQPGKH